MRLNAKIIALLSYFISRLSLQTLDKTRGQGHGVTRLSRGADQSMADIPHDNLLYFVRMMTSLFHDRPVSIVSTRGAHDLFLLLPPSPHIASLAWSPQPPIMSALATNSGAQNTSTQLHLCVQMRGHWLDSAASKHSEGTGQFFLTF